MKIMFALLFGALITLAGCSSTKQVELAQKDQWIADAQSDLVGSYATITSTDGRTGAGTIFKMNADSLSLRDEGSGTVMTFDVNHVAYIQQSSNAWPAVGGFVGGALIGGLIGGAIGTSEATSANSVESGVETFVWAPVIGVAVGGVAGAAILGAATSTTSYQILYTTPRTSTTRRTSAMPDSTRQRK